MAKDIINKVRNQKHYIPLLKKEFPNLTEKQLEMIVKEGCYQLQKFMVIDHRDVLLKNNLRKLSMTFFKYIPTFKRKRNGDSQESVSDS